MGWMTEVLKWGGGGGIGIYKSADLPKFEAKAPNCRGPLVFELTLLNEHYATAWVEH
jgi:hypothetical protein